MLTAALTQGQHRTRLVTITQFSAGAQSCATPCDPMNHSTPGLPDIINSQSSPKLTSIESVMPSSHLILCRPLLLFFLFVSKVNHSISQ